MIQIGRICVKIAGRDAGKKCVILDILDDNYVLIDGETRRRKCNIMHLEPLSENVEVNKNAPHNDVAKAFEKLGLKARETKPKEKKEKPKQKRKTPEQLKAQKEEKRKLRDLFRIKKKEEKKEETSLEAKAGLSEEKQIVPAQHHELVTAGHKEVAVKELPKAEKKSAPKTAAKVQKKTA